MAGNMANRYAFLVLSLSICAPVRGALIEFVPVPISPAAIAENPILATAHCADLRVTLQNSEVFNLIGVNAFPAAGGSFYQHVFGSDIAPSAGAIAVFPSLAFDTYMTVPPEFQVYVGPSFVGQPSEAAWNTARLNRVWRHQGPNFSYTTPFNLARITWFGEPPSGDGILFVHNPQQQIPFTFAIPEPGVSGVFGLFSLIALQRGRCRAGS